MSDLDDGEGLRDWGSRQVVQRLEALRRAGLAFLPRTAMQRRLEQRAGAATSPGFEPPVGPDIEEPAAMGSLFEDTLTAKPKVPVGKRLAVLEALRDVVSTCPRCPQLVATRTQTVFGEGSPSARLMFIGEAPGADEDRTGRPFVGRAGRLLDDMITKGMGLRREDVYIANVIKCRPPENRVPLPDEIANCREYLDKQIELIRPEFLCLLGKTAASALLGTPLPMGKLRGKWFSYQGIKAIVTYHPSYLLRQPSGKKDAWEDLKLLMREMGLPLPKK